MCILSFVTVSNFRLHMEITGNLHHNIIIMMYINLMYTIYNVFLCVKYAVTIGFLRALILIDEHI